MEDPGAPLPRAGRAYLGLTVAHAVMSAQVNMLRHDYVPVNVKPETAPHPLQG